MRTRVSYPQEVKLKAVEMKLQGIPTKVKQGHGWYKNGEMHRFKQPVAKQYTFGKGTDGLSDIEQLKLENKFLKQQIKVLKKYAELERKWLDK